MLVPFYLVVLVLFLEVVRVGRKIAPQPNICNDFARNMKLGLEVGKYATSKSLYINANSP